ncbi:alanine racemase [Terribacillus halophilus]|uniref:Alanine racemase n=1 Tax=Terribacillus halophilus TaxID=361279 RepID=A0A1G6RZR3_9BACI|nr:alanine racemase [Terribacillus halophilus]SDD09417.1 alanine racemase [Terribacillus halophilus]
MRNDHFYRDSWVEINLDHVEYNIKQLAAHIGEDKGIYGVVKANAYGHGYVQVAQTALDAGAQALAVAFLDEALHLRKNGVHAAILVLGATRPEDAAIAADHDISLTFYRKDWLEAVRTQRFRKPLQLHMKLDTGMGRLGFRTEEEIHAALPLLDVPSLHLEGVYTHFATADDADLAYFEGQRSKFDKLYKSLQKAWPHPLIVHSDNSAASMRFAADESDFVRFGIGMYGLYPSKIVKEEHPIALRQAFSLHSKLVHVKQLEAHEAVSYGATYETNKAEWIGTLPIGYADGWIRKMQGFEVLVEGKRMPIVGRVCMDQCMVKLDKAYPNGTEVVLIGMQQNAFISMDEVADWIDTINYEVPCLIAARMPRVYKRSGRIVEVANALSPGESL